MKLFLVAVYDKRSKEYSPPQAYITLGVAERAFSDAVNDPNTHLHRHPEDYNMQVIGMYESETAEIYPEVAHILLEAAQTLTPKQ